MVNICGCQKPLCFPERSLTAAAQIAKASAAYDTDGDKQADFYTFTDPSGRVTRLGYGALVEGQPQQIVNLGELAFEGRRHLVVVLDGFGYHVVKDYYDSGGLRMFYPPSRVIAPYPTLTDLAMEDLLGYRALHGF